jgi:hypothetical protein
MQSQAQEQNKQGLGVMARFQLVQRAAHAREGKADPTARHVASQNTEKYKQVNTHSVANFLTSWSARAPDTESARTLPRADRAMLEHGGGNGKRGERGW